MKRREVVSPRTSSSHVLEQVASLTAEVRQAQVIADLRQKGNRHVA